ncbi:MAG: MarR family transcriptional regulator [Polyangiaceae bacterium]
MATILRMRCVELLTDAGVTLHEVAVLSCLEESGPLYHNDLALRIGINKATLVPIGSRLSSASLVTFDYEVADRRRTELTLTSIGEALLRDIEARMIRLENEVFSCLSDDERRILSRALARLLAPHC